MLPNKFRNSNFHKANQVYVIPDPLHNYSLAVFGPFGTEKIILYASTVPLGYVEVTKSDNNVLYEIDNTTAFNYFKYHLGEEIMNETAIMGEYPLAVYEEDEKSFYMRASTIVDKEAGTMIFLGNVPQGSMVQITHTTRKEIIEAATKAVNSSVSDYPGSNPVVALCFSCAARKQILGTKVGEEYNAFKDNFPELPVIGFYTYGEMGPLGKDKPARFHNETFINLVIGED